MILKEKIIDSDREINDFLQQKSFILKSESIDFELWKSLILTSKSMSMVVAPADGCSGSQRAIEEERQVGKI